MPAEKEETIINTGVVYLGQTKVNSQIIYVITLFAVVLALSALPFLYITISIKSFGMIKINQEKIEVVAPVSGHLLRLNLRDNQRVIKGTTLLIIDNRTGKQQRNVLNNSEKNLNRLLKDTEKLIEGVNTKFQSNFSDLETGLYTTSWQEYRQQFQNAANASRQAERIYERYNTLYQKNAITKAEFEQYKFNYEQAISNQEMTNIMFKNQWQKEANQYRKELDGLLHQKVGLIEQQKQCSVKATINGSVQNLIGLQEGTFIPANQKIAEISPEGLLFAYCYLKSSDIGLVKKGQIVRFQIDAFNYNQWGMLIGKVIEISDDITIQNEQAYFKVKCQLDKNYLQLKSGYRGFIKKGMAFTANFTLAKRSLYQLLFDKIDDWVN